MTRADRVAGWLARGVRGWMAAAASILFAMFTAVVLPAQARTGAFYTSSRAAPDTLLWYQADDLYAAAEAWGPAGRAAYVQARVTFDVLWPLVYGMFLVVTLAWVWARGTPVRSPWRRVALLPVVVIGLDYAENACTATVMLRYPQPTPVFAELAPVFTAAKWLTLSACFALLLVGIAVAVRTRIAGEGEAEPPG